MFSDEGQICHVILDMIKFLREICQVQVEFVVWMGTEIFPQLESDLPFNIQQNKKLKKNPGPNHCLNVSVSMSGRSAKKNTDKETSFP